MKRKFLSKEWKNLYGKNYFQKEIEIGDAGWLRELLGWKKKL